MGNLYTHLVSRPDSRLETLGKLRVLWGNFKAARQPNQKRRILQEIGQLQKSLRPVKSHSNQLQTYADYQRKYGSFAWKAWEQRNSTNQPKLNSRDLSKAT